MEPLHLITFLSDYGWNNGYVAACELVIACIDPLCRVIHIDHDIEPGNVRRGGHILGRVAPLGPAAVHLAVVDPGVGTERRALAIRATRGDYLLGPDNGLLPAAAQALGDSVEAWTLDPVRVRAACNLPPRAMSRTFHGRDLFAPAAALLSTGAQGSDLGEAVELSSIIDPPPTRLERRPGEVLAEVIETDRFGNVALGVPFVTLEEFRVGAKVVVCVGVEEEWRARIVLTFGELGSGELGLFEDSWGMAGLALNGASAAELLGVRVGDTVRVALLAVDDNPAAACRGV